ncbi:NYN domain-containing protein [Methanoculleus sp.]|jgi:hypothetical protein|uniref:NYN domain-containing protein n=1 Tax=Methanoculleus sp. TaxID=90427 RepID=UPI001BD35F3A|nr:NYN domain-containing protein [Methanoculleus sp.]
MDGLNVGIYLDFANLSISASNTYPHLEKPLDVEPLMDYAASEGTIIVKRAYADWTQPYATSYVRMLVDHGFEMRHVPVMNSQGKNASDLQMTIDILNDIQYLPLDIFILGSGDTDFVPLTRNIIEKGKRVHVVGFEVSVGPVLKKNCTIFKSMDDLLSLAGNKDAGSDVSKPGVDRGPPLSKARNLLIRFTRTRAPGERIHLSELKNQLLRMEPSFSEKSLGLPSFKPFVESFVGDVVEKIETDPRTGHPLVIFRESPLISGETAATDDEALNRDVSQFLERSVSYPKDRNTRLALAQQFINCFKDQNTPSILEVTEYICQHISFDYPKESVKRFVLALGEGRAMHFARVAAEHPLFTFPQEINEGLDDPVEVELIYRSRVVELVRNKFPKIENKQLLRLMNLVPHHG